MAEEEGGAEAVAEAAAEAKFMNHTLGRGHSLLKHARCMHLHSMRRILVVQMHTTLLLLGQMHTTVLLLGRAVLALVIPISRLST